MFSYFAYGLGIQSELPIPEFVPALRGEDVTIYLNKDTTLNDYLPQDTISQIWALKLNKQQALFYVKDTALFIIEGGEKIVVVPTADASEQLIRLYLVGTVMAILLYQRGLLVLHASAVNIDGGVVAFLGESGQGKSSTAAAFYTRGHEIITDDVAPVTLGEQPAAISPGFPQIKLAQQTATALGYNFDSLVELHSSLDKRGYRFTEKFPKTALPIRSIYTLAFGEEFSITPLKPQEAVIELIRHSRPTTLYHNGGACHFLQCAALAKECTIHRLVRPRNLSLLPELVKLVEEHVASDLAATIVQVRNF